MTRVAGTLYASGGVLILTALTTLGDRVSSLAGVALVSLSSIVFGVALFLVGERFPVPASVHVFTSALGTAVVSVIVMLGGEPTAALFGIFYVYVAAFCFYYLPMSWAVGEVALTGVGYAVALAVVNLPGAIGVWVLVMGGSITAGALIGRLGQQQRSLAANLAASDVARATMLQIVSHDLQGPLGTIVGSADTLLQRLPQLSPAVVRDLVGAQQRQAQKLLDLVGDVLATERVAAGKLSLNPHQVELRTLVNNTVGTFGTDSQRVSVTGGPVTVEADPILMQRAIENLIGNALRHSEGRVQVDIDTDSDAEIEIHVSDHGAGIPEDLLGSVFEPFVQSRAAKAAALPGSACPSPEPLSTPTGARSPPSTAGTAAPSSRSPCQQQHECNPGSSPDVRAEDVDEHSLGDLVPMEGPQGAAAASEQAKTHRPGRTLACRPSPPFIPSSTMDEHEPPDEPQRLTRRWRFGACWSRRPSCSPAQPTRAPSPGPMARRCPRPARWSGPVTPSSRCSGTNPHDVRRSRNLFIAAVDGLVVLALLSTLLLFLALGAYAPLGVVLVNRGWSVVAAWVVAQVVAVLVAERTRGAIFVWL